METAYTQITEVPSDLPEAWNFLEGLNLPDHKHAELTLLLERINYNAALKAVNYCTEKIKDAKVAEAAELHYETILELQRFHVHHHRFDAYSTIYDKMRKLIRAGYKAWMRLIVRSLRRVVATQVRMMTLLDARAR